MTFATPELLLLLPIALLALGIMLAGDFARRRATRRLGEAKMIDALITFDAGPRRTLKGALRILAVVLAIVAMARPRYGRGTKTVPATDVSVVVALDCSKSMYAQDVLPSRLERARSDVALMIHEVPRARWGAVAFAGEAVGFAPTTDGPQAAQFLNAHEPYEMPGGTAIAKAIELARQQLVPKEEAAAVIEGAPAPKPGSDKRNKRVIVLVTDGEDLEGDPVEAARNAFDAGIQIHVVMVGGRAPQPIPDVDPDSGVARGYITDERGQMVTTELEPEAEKQLQSIASETHGLFVRTEDGTTGVAKIEAALKALLASEGTEQTETLYADQFAIPLAVALGLLLLDAMIGESPLRRARIAPPPPPPSRRSSNVA